jgi:hypothetical protein
MATGSGRSHFSAPLPAAAPVANDACSHVCVVVNMMDEVVMVRGEEIVGTLKVAARGKLR